MKSPLLALVLALAAGAAQAGDDPGDAPLDAPGRHRRGIGATGPEAESDDDEREAARRDELEVVADDLVDVVYVATPHSEHHEHALLAIAAGRHRGGHPVPGVVARGWRPAWLTYTVRRCTQCPAGAHH